MKNSLNQTAYLNAPESGRILRVCVTESGPLYFVIAEQDLGGLLTGVFFPSSRWKELC